jgi:hypothetical protein
MYLALRYAAHFLGAIVAAFYLYVLVHDELGISRRSIFVYAFGSACVLCLACVAATTVRRRMK